MIEIKAVPGKLIMLGKQGENLAREVIFDVSGVRAEFGDGTFRLVAKRPGEADAYPATVTETGDTVVWALTGADTQNAGHGQCELAFYAGETRFKTWTYDTAIAKSLTGSPKTDPYDEFLDEVNRLAAEAAISQRGAKNSEENAKASEDAAKTSENNAAEYARAALAAESKSKQNAEYAASAATAAGQYAQNAATSATNAASSASAAETHEKGAKDAATAAAKSAEGLADAVKRAEDAAATAQDNAGKTAADREAVAEMKTAAQTAQGNAEKAATAAAGSATSAGESAAAAETSRAGAAEIKTQIDEIKAGIDTTKGEIDQAKADIDQTKTDTLAAKTAAETAAATATEKAAEIADSAAQIATNTENIGKNATQIATNTENIGKNATGIETNTEDIDLLRRENVELRAKTDALWKLSEGKSYDFVEDSAEAYSKDVPSGCRFAQVEKIGGKTAAWNQCAKITSNSAASNGITRTVDGGIITLSGTLAELGYFTWDPAGSEMAIIDHVYLFGKHIIANPANISFYYGQFNRDGFKGPVTSADSASIKKMTKELAAHGNGHGLGGMTAGTDLTGIKLQVFDIDLTRLFGSGNEPTTTDDPRIAEIIAYAEKHPEYNAGELVSAGVEDVEVQGANLLRITPFSTTTKNGVTFEFVEPGGIKMKGTASANTDLPTFPVQMAPGKYYGWGQDGSGYVASVVVMREGAPLWINAKGSFTILDGDITKYWYILILAGTSVDVVIHPYIIKGSTAPPAYPAYSLDTYPIPDAVKALPGYGWGAGNLCNEIVRRADGWDYVQRVGLPATTDGYTALDNPTTTDITDLMTGALPLMATEPGGTITMHHALADGGLTLDVPNAVKFIRDLMEVASSGTE